MMSSNMLSRMLPSTSGSPSIYEAIREHDQIAEGQPTQEVDDYQDDAAIDEDNLREPFHDQDVADLLVEATGSPIETENTPFLDDIRTSREQPSQQAASPLRNQGSRRPIWMRKGSRGNRHFVEEDDVPESLLLEDDRYKAGLSSPEETPKTANLPEGPQLPPPVPGPSSRQTQAQWRTTQARQALYEEQKQQTFRKPGAEPGKRASASAILLNADPAQKALWRWTNVENLDNFLSEVYVYYLDKGIYSIILTRFLGLLTTAFVIGIVTFLGHCIDYRRIPASQSLHEVLIPRCTAKMSGVTNIFLWMFAFLWVFKVFEYILDIRRLKFLHDFYLYLLEISDKEMQTISWQEIVGRLMNLRNANPRTAVNKQAPQVAKFLGGDKSKQRMDAHDIANRLMRRENYLIALFNKDILDLTLPVPFLGNRQLFSKTLEWSIDLAVIDYVFNEKGQVRQLFLKDTERKRLIEALQWRFKFVGLANVICAPFIIAYLLFFYFLRYFTEFSKNPAQLGSRAYTPLAEWKFREFNELRHLFERRSDMSYPYASRYLDQFPKHKTVELAKFVAFIAGSLAAILGVATVLDPELFLGFHITPDRTAFFYLGILVPLWAVARGMVPDENLVFDPEFAIQEVINFTHYCPSTWKGRLHTDDVKREFSSLYKLKLLIFLEEILSIIFAPFVLWFSLPRCSERLIDFFREFTIHVDGLGYVCSFALFDFKKGTPAPSSSAKPGPGEAGVDARGDYYSTKDGKMLASYYSFLDSYANNPRRGGSSLRRHPPAALHQRPFNPPPAFPGLSSSPASPQQNFREASVMRGSNRPMSPSPSMLLDPHHQPTRSTTTLGRSVLARRQHPPSSQPPLEEEEAEDDATDEESYELSAGMDEPDPLASASADGTGAGESGGVLGLLYQFQKAQTETGRGKSAGIGI